MAWKKLSYAASSTRKRFDAQIEVRPFWKSNWRFTLRILSPEELSEDQVEEAIEQVVDRVGEWRQTKTGYSLSINGSPANAYITKVSKDISNEEEE